LPPTSEVFRAINIPVVAPGALLANIHVALTAPDVFRNSLRFMLSSAAGRLPTSATRCRAMSMLTDSL
jgi:hypothetical protein